MREAENRREVMEAIEAADRAVMSLERARDELSSARSWGMWDLFGGGFVSTLCKHSRMDDAKAAMNEAKGHLRTLKRELLDVSITEDFKLEVGDFLSFADYFFDGFIADFMVQTKINDAASQVEAAIDNVKKIRGSLKKMLNELDGRAYIEGGIE